MALDFTVVFSSRQRFGDNTADDTGQDPDALFVGQQKDFEFRCPKVDRNQDAILLFQCQGVNAPQSLEINGKKIFGGIPRSVEALTGPGVFAWVALWIGNIMLIHPRVLQENNVLRIRAGEISDGKIDNFIIDNVVVLFKTKQGPVIVTDAVTDAINR